MLSLSVLLVVPFDHRKIPLVVSTIPVVAHSDWQMANFYDRTMVCHCSLLYGFTCVIKKTDM